MLDLVDSKASIDFSPVMEFQARPLNMDAVFARVKKKRIKKLRGPDSPLYKVIWPMIYVVRIFGFAPYNFSQDRLVPSNFNLIFTTIAGTFYSYILYDVFYRLLSVRRDTWTLGGTENTKVSKELVERKTTLSRLGLP